MKSEIYQDLRDKYFEKKYGTLCATIASIVFVGLLVAVYLSSH